MLIALAAAAALSGTASAAAEFAVDLSLDPTGTSASPLPGLAFGLDFPVGPVSIGAKVHGV
ncbi:MAG TPA: hypothetical protein VHN99_01400, partial [Deinococcales bacterium]|nr:hypothetical protein [Deinococcales bacterium]